MTTRLRTPELARRIGADGLVLRHDEPVRTDPTRELGVRSRVVTVDPASQDGNGSPSALERSAVRLAVDPPRHPADDDQARRRQLAGERARDRLPDAEHALAPTMATAGSASSATSAAPRE